jgi:hypothetical protein
MLGSLWDQAGRRGSPTPAELSARCRLLADNVGLPGFRELVIARDLDARRDVVLRWSRGPPPRSHSARRAPEAECRAEVVGSRRRAPHLRRDRAALSVAVVAIRIP